VSDTVAFVSENYDPGGAEMVLARVAGELHAQGRPVLAIVGPDDWLIGKLRAAGVPTRVMNLYVGARPAMLRARREVRAALRSHRVGTLVSWDFTAHVLGALAGPARFFPNIRGLVYDWSAPRRRVLWRRLIAPRATHIICVSRAAQEAVCAHVPAAREKTLIIGNGVDAERFRSLPDRAAARREAGLPEDGYVIGTIGRLHPVKGHGDLLAALARLAQANGAPPHLVIAGPAPEEEKARLLERARAEGVEHLLHLLGHREDVPDLLAAMDVFTLPSLSEGMPNALLEAMAAGKPVVATRVGGSAELVSDGETGLLVPPGAPEALAEVLAGLRADPARAARLGEAARAAVAPRSWPCVIAQYTGLLFGEHS